MEFVETMESLERFEAVWRKPSRGIAKSDNEQENAQK